ncbi:MAG: hypothetical protein GC168_16120 [Candidatus Hydrogenedens sp.]|nr:hypothetical protein [Candidatus Hydrogenedens sp.]
MSHLEPRSILRPRASREDGRVLFIELFFDLVFVFAVTQLSHSLLHHFTIAGLVETAFLFLAVWWVWIYTTWVTNWLDPQATSVRLLLFVLMFAGLLLSISIPHAFGESGLLFAGAYAFMQVGRSVFMCCVLRGRHERNYRNFLRITTWLSVSGALWILGGCVEHEARYAVWGAALLIEYVSPAFGFWTPGLGKSTTADWDVAGGHIAERCGLFMIIAFGESLLVTGATVAELPWTLVNGTAFVTVFAGTIAMWWIYFNAGAEYASKRIEESDDPGRLARLAYTYLHLPLVAAVILVAVADENVLQHPLGHASGLGAFAILGGPALYLLGNLLFKRAVFGRIAVSRIVAMAVLGGVAFGYGMLSPLVLSMIATAALAAVGAWESWLIHRGAIERC